MTTEGSFGESIGNSPDEPFDFFVDQAFSPEQSLAPDLAPTHEPDPPTLLERPATTKNAKPPQPEQSWRDRTTW